MGFWQTHVSSNKRRLIEPLPPPVPLEFGRETEWLDRHKRVHVEQLRATPETGADPDMIFEAAALIEHLRCTVSKLAALAQHSDGCSWITPLPTGQGYWGCDCGLNDLVLDGEPTDAALTPNDAERTR